MRTDYSVTITELDPEGTVDMNTGEEHLTAIYVRVRVTRASTDTEREIFVTHDVDGHSIECRQFDEVEERPLNVPILMVGLQAAREAVIEFMMSNPELDDHEYVGVDEILGGQVVGSYGVADSVPFNI